MCDELRSETHLNVDMNRSASRFFAGLQIVDGLIFISEEQVIKSIIAVLLGDKGGEMKTR